MMKVTSFIKPAGIGLVAVAITNYISPSYTEITTVGAGLYILYSVISYKETTPIATNIKYDKTSNKVIADIKNPSDNTHAFLAQIRLKEMMKQPEEGMMTASTISDRTTLIGETDSPIIIGPNEMISIECPLLIPQEMYESADGSLNIKLTFHDVQIAIAEMTKKKIEDKIATIEQKIKEPTIIPVPDAPVDIPSVEAHINIPVIVIPTKDTDTTIQEVEMIGDMEGVSYHWKNTLKPMINEIKKDLYTDSLRNISIPMNDKRSGRYIGHSQTMLEIIRTIDRLNNISNDAI